jgi:hypothetical protein
LAAGSTSPAVSLTGTLTAGSSELFYGSAASGTATWSATSPAGFTQLIGTGIVGSLFSSDGYIGVSAATVAGTNALSASSPWGVFGIEIEP